MFPSSRGSPLEREFLGLARLLRCQLPGPSHKQCFCPRAGQIMLNGQVVPGLTLEAHAGALQASPPPLLPSGGRPSSSSSGSLASSSQQQQLLESLLNGGGPTSLSPRSSSRSSPMLDGLAGINGSAILGGHRVPILAAGSGLGQ